MELDLKKRLAGCVFIIPFLLFTFIAANGQRGQRAPFSDSVRRVEIKVVAKEKVENYDSIFQNSTAKATSRILKGNKKSVKKIPVPKNVSASAETSHLNADVTALPDWKKDKTIHSEKKSGYESYADNSVESSSITENTDTSSSYAADSLIGNKIPEKAERYEEVIQEQSGGDTLSIPKSSLSNKISYLWIGFVLVIGGIVLGLIFGRAAFMVSIVGLVFLLIGFYVGQ